MPFDFGSAFVKVLAQVDPRFRADVVREATRAGDEGGKAAAAATSKSLGGAGIAIAKTFGTVVAGGFGIAAARGLELEKVTARVRAETGLTGEAAVKAGEAINRMSGSNMQGLEEIANTLSKVHTDLGLTGDAAEALTQRFLTFGRATRQDAGAAVSAFDDILDGFDLTAEDAAGIMDQLVASHQKFGGSVTENQAALSAMAPALRAMNLGVDDGVAVLNLFAASGIDASSAATLLQKAVKNLKPGQDLDDLVTQLGNIEDPTLRAQKAIELFGKAGAKIANAIKPGTTSLDEFAVSAEDSVGATDKAREALDSTFGAWAQQQLKAFGATITSTLGAGGPVLSALAGLSTLAGSLGLDKALAKAWKGLGGSALLKGAVAIAGAAAGTVYGAALSGGQAIVSALATAFGRAPGAAAVRSAITSAGAFMGTTMGAAFSVAFAAAAIAAVAVVFIDVKNRIDQQGRELIDQTATWAKTASLEALKKSREGVAAQLAAVGSDPIAEALGLSAKPAIQKVLDELDAQIAAGGAKIAQAAPSAIFASKANAEEAARAFVSDLDTVFTEAVDQGQMFGPLITAAETGVTDTVAALAKLPPEARRVGFDALQKTADGIDAARQLPLDAFNRLITAMKTPLTETGETARLLGELASKELAKGLISGDPAIRAQARATKAAILDRLAELEPSAGTMSKAAMASLAAGLKSKDPEIRAAAENINMIVKAELALTDAKLWAQHAAEAYAQGFSSRSDFLAEQVRTFLASGTKAMVAASPPKEGPLTQIDKWGERTGLAWVEGFLQSLGEAPAKIKDKLGWVKKAFDDFVKGYNPIGNLLGGLTPEADRANLTSYIASLQAALPKETDPENRLAILRQIVDYRQRLADLDGKVATADQEQTATLQQYINNLDKALLTETDPKRIAAMTAELETYVARLDKLLAPKTRTETRDAAADARDLAEAGLEVQQLDLEHRRALLSTTPELEKQNAVQLDLIDAQLAQIKNQLAQIGYERQKASLLQQQLDLYNAINGTQLKTLGRDLPAAGGPSTLADSPWMEPKGTPMATTSPAYASAGPWAPGYQPRGPEGTYNPDGTINLPGGYTGVGNSQTINVYNPTPEPASRSVTDALKLASAFPR